MNIRLILSSLAASAALCIAPGTARAQIFVTNLSSDYSTGTVVEYTTSGVPVNPALITGLNFPEGIAVSGGNLFVTNFDRIGKYTLSGVPVNPALITGLIAARPIAVSGANLFVGSDNPTCECSRIGKYTTSGATVNPTLIPDAGALARGIAVSGDKLFVADDVGGAVGEYTTSGATVNAALVSGLTHPIGIAVVTASVPDATSTWVLLLLGLTALFGLKLMLRQPV